MVKRNKFKRFIHSIPWATYTGVVVFIALMLMLVIVAAINHNRNIVDTVTTEESEPETETIIETVSIVRQTDSEDLYFRQRKEKTMAIKSYKGFNKDMTCKGFQYEEGKEYETERAECCETGFHACEYPLDCFSHYAPNGSVYHEVEQDGDIDREDDGTKIASTKIKIGARISIAGIVKAAIEYTMSRTKKEASKDDDCGTSSATGSYGASSATGYKGASSATGYKGASSATGDYGASSATGDYGASSATGYKGASSATGDYGASSATGYKGASSATGSYGASSATGSCGASSATGYKGASSADHKDAVAVAWGYRGRAKGVLGSHLVLANWEGNDSQYWKPEYWELKGAKMVQVDGKDIKPDTWYTMENGEIVEWDEEE